MNETIEKNEAQEAVDTEQDTAPAGDEQQRNDQAVDQVVEESFKQQFMRVTADFANYKRRMDKERAQWVTTGQTAIITAFLPIVDDVERALAATRSAQSAQDNKNLAQILEGFELIEKNLHKVLDQLGVAPISCEGAFDPEQHEALLQTASEKHESGQVVDVLSKGYTYKGAVLRHAKVSVAA